MYYIRYKMSYKTWIQTCYLYTISILTLNGQPLSQDAISKKGTIGKKIAFCTSLFHSTYDSSPIMNFFFKCNDKIHGLLLVIYNFIMGNNASFFPQYINTSFCLSHIFHIFQQTCG